ncbi:ABC transporter substrate-binding protein [Neoaquamicrobium sediminum]|uniref:ABC transporter substrate-binding protein n=1 Tax=Neoaquamicrobium sediminum TaxID=1849104 RepID=UPI001566F60F|nr:ABC transporter substrate-binding protein [Mesorhizobium sediminum]NRC56867.1 ABC transporter substrate-binding protein [Mesorhizobium sediminum]
MNDRTKPSSLLTTGISRRGALKGLGAAAALGTAPGFVRYAQSQSSEPIRIGFQAHRTGIGAAYGRWYERTTAAAIKRINDAGGINGRPVEIITEDDGTDAARGAEVVEKFANQHKTDIVYGTLFSHVVVGSAPAAGELKMPYYVVSEGYHVASGKMNRYVLQPGITDVRAQCRSVAPWITSNVGKKITMIYPDYAFGHDHRDFFAPAAAEQGGDVIAQIPIPPTESSFTRYLPQIPPDTDVIYHVMVGPAVLTFVKELGEFYGGSGPKLFGFIDSLEAVDINSPGLEFLEGSHFWEGMPRYLQDGASEHEKAYREAVGLDENGASVNDAKDVSTAAHMFGCWETLYIIKAAMEAAGYRGPEDRAKLVEATEAMTEFPEGAEHPQGAKVFDGKVHQVFGSQNISVVENGRLNVVHRTSIEDGRYEPEADYTTQPL